MIDLWTNEGPAPPHKAGVYQEQMFVEKAQSIISEYANNVTARAAGPLFLYCTHSQYPFDNTCRPAPREDQSLTIFVTTDIALGRMKLVWMQTPVTPFIRRWKSRRPTLIGFLVRKLSCARLHYACTR
jgi:hypothetical protein